MNEDIKSLLEDKYLEYAKSSFVEDDPISIPKSYSKKEDIEITAFWTAIFSWGQRKTIINKAKFLFDLMDNDPHNFILHHSPIELKRFEKFVHRTFQATDTLYFIEFFKTHYTKYNSLEQAFMNGKRMEEKLSNFHNYFFSLPYFPSRTKKHIATPQRKSTCKRINMFLRWMVRTNKEGIDFNLWKSIQPSELLIPFDVHVERVARNLGLLKRKQKDWLSVLEITDHLKELDPHDPIKYDFALFGMGVLDKNN